MCTNDLKCFNILFLAVFHKGLVAIIAMKCGINLLTLVMTTDHRFD